MGQYPNQGSEECGPRGFLGMGSGDEGGLKGSPAQADALDGTAFPRGTPIFEDLGRDLHSGQILGNRKEGSV